MRTFKLFSLISLLLIGLSRMSALAQTSFQNLDFEQAAPVPIVGNPSDPSGVTAASALPDWTVYLGNSTYGIVDYNDESLGTAAVDIVSPRYKFGGVIDGQYSVILQSGEFPFNGPLVSASIAQDGMALSGQNPWSLRPTMDPNMDPNCCPSLSTETAFHLLSLDRVRKAHQTSPMRSTAST